MASRETRSDSQVRRLSGFANGLLGVFLSIITIGSAFWVIELPVLFDLALFTEQFLGLLLALTLASVFLGIRASRTAPAEHVPWYDWVLAGLSLLVGGYVGFLFPAISLTLGALTPERWILGGIAIFLVLEGTRRTIGWAVVWLAVVTMLYAKFAYLLPGIFYAKGSSWERIAAYLYLDFNGLFGLPLVVTGNIIVAFIFFGQALYASGGDRFFTDLALSIFGGFRGGAAKVAIISSSLFGMVSGSAVSNVIISGSITIPMMKRAGYPGRLAAAIEAVASTGGQIAPPVMGTAAFLIAMILNTQYREVVIAAAIPAFLYYVALFTQVDLEAAKRNFPSLPADQLPKFGAVIIRGWVFLVPLAFLIFTLLVLNWQPGKAAIASAVLVFGVGALKRETRPTWRQLVTAVRETGRIVLYIVTIAALAGFVIGSLHLSGFAFKIPILMLSIAGGSTELLLVLTAFACIVLGMGMPTAVVYLMLAILVAPALVQLGVVPMAAHMFVFYFGMMSMITPPVCISTYAACAIAGENFWRTGLTGARLGIVAFLVPFVVALNPAIIFRGTGYDIALALVTTSVGVALLSVAVVGHLARPLDVWGRVAVGIAGFLLLIPKTYGVPPWAVDLAGFTLGAAFILVHWRRVLPATVRWQRQEIR